MEAPYHIWHKGVALTYLVFGPYGTYYDVEIHHGHINPNDKLDNSDTLITTYSDLPRNTHVVGDLWDTADHIVADMCNASG